MLGAELITEKGGATPKISTWRPKTQGQHTVLRGNLRSLVSLVRGIAAPRPICYDGKSREA